MILKAYPPIFLLLFLFSFGAFGVALALTIRGLVSNQPAMVVKDFQRIFLRKDKKMKAPSKMALLFFLRFPGSVGILSSCISILHFLPLLALSLIFRNEMLTFLFAFLISSIQMINIVNNLDRNITVRKLSGLLILQSATKWLPSEQRMRHFVHWATRRNKVRKELGMLGLEMLPDDCLFRAVKQLRAIGWNEGQLQGLLVNRPTQLCLPITLTDVQWEQFGSVAHHTYSPWTEEEAEQLSLDWAVSLATLRRLAPLMRNEAEIICLNCLCKPTEEAFGRLELPICPNCQTQHFLAGPISRLVAHFSEGHSIEFHDGQLHFPIHQKGWHPSARPDILCLDEDLQENANIELASYLEFCENNEIGSGKQVSVLNESQQALDDNLLHMLNEKGIILLSSPSLTK